MIKKNFLTYRSNVKTLSLKFYDEQLPEGGIEEVISNIKKIDKNKIQVIGIKHDQDSNHDNIWIPSIEKAHYHIIIRVISSTPMHVSTLINLIGVIYRPDVDDEMWKNHGAETIANYSRYAMYLTHDTEEAQLDGKHQYPLEAIFSNLTIEEIKLIREGYVRPERVKVTMNELEELDKIAFNLGYELGSYNDWYSQWAFAIRTNQKKKVIEESYNRGVAKRIAEQTEIMRLSVFLKGNANCGKSYACEHAFENLKKLKIEGGGSGKYDHLSIDTEVILINDDVAPNLLNMSDNYICRAYRRNSNNPIWKGNFFVVTSNKEFDSWVHDCGIHNDANIEAVRSRFYVCHINDNGKIVVDSYSSRGSIAMQQERLNEFMKFIKKVQDSIDEYNLNYKNQNKVDYSILNDMRYDQTLAEENINNFLKNYDKIIGGI